VTDSQAECTNKSAVEYRSVRAETVATKGTLDHSKTVTLVPSCL